MKIWKTNLNCSSTEINVFTVFSVYWQHSPFIEKNYELAHKIVYIKLLFYSQNNNFVEKLKSYKTTMFYKRIVINLNFRKWGRDLNSFVLVLFLW